jgi:hypothetical protein
VVLAAHKDGLPPVELARDQANRSLAIE